MSKIFLAFAVALVCVSSSSSAGTDVTTLKKVPPKVFPCELDIYGSQDEIQRPYEKLAVISVEDTAFFGASARAETMTKLKKASCKAGADAVIIKGWAGNEEGKWYFHSGPGHETVDAVAIRYTGDSPSSGAATSAASADPREAYATGISVGLWLHDLMTLYEDAVVEQITLRHAQPPYATGEKVLNDAKAHRISHAAAKLPAAQINSEMESFYSEPKNKGIDEVRALEYVVSVLAGMPESDAKPCLEGKPPGWWNH